MPSWCEETLANLPAAEAELREEVDHYAEFWAIVGRSQANYFRPTPENLASIMVENGWHWQDAERYASWGISGVIPRMCRPCAELLVEGYQPLPCPECAGKVES